MCKKLEIKVYLTTFDLIIFYNPIATAFYLLLIFIYALPIPTRRTTNPEKMFLIEIGEYCPVPSFPLSSSHEMAASVPIEWASFISLSIVPLSSKVSI